MVLGIRSKSRKSVKVQVDYLVRVQEIKPWPLSQSKKSAQSVFLQWENGDQASGSLTSGVGDGKIEFTESFRLPVTLCKEVSRKDQARETYQKNNLEFYLYESRKDKAMKGQLLGSAVINLAEYGIIRETISATALVNCKKSSKNLGQPILYVNIQPFGNGSSSSSPKGSLSKEASLDNDGSESVSEAMLDGNDEEAEIASFTDDDVDDDVSSHSLRTISSSAFEATVSSTTDSVKIEPETTKDEIERNLGEPSVASRAEPAKTRSNPLAQTVNTPKESSAYLSSLGYSNSGNSANDDPAFPYIPQDRSVPMLKKSATHGVRSSSSLRYPDDPRKAVNKRLVDESCQIPGYAQESRRANFVASLNKVASLSMYSQDEAKRNRTDPQATQEADRNVWRQSENGKEEASTNDFSTYISSDIGVPQNVFKNNKLKHVKSVQLPSDTGKNNIPIVLDNIEFIENPKRTDMTQDTRDGVMASSLSEEKETSKRFSDSKGVLKAEIEMLKEELKEAAAVEVGLYSVVAEHGSSTNKIHAPARRISRFYFHACKASSPTMKANAARAAVSGFVLVSKACGNDVPRLTFWLSNSIMLRAIICQTVGNLAGGPGVDRSSGLGQDGLTPHTEEKVDKKENLNDWDDHQTFLIALEKFESWVFLRIVESVWWQTMTPHMQPAAAKGSSSRKASGRKYGFGDQEQGNFSIELWKKAFKDACQRLCPAQAGGHECGCLPVIARLVMEQLVDRLDVAMFNAILRENGEEMPTDPVSDPISDPKVLPVPAGRSSFGAGAQLKNAIGSWSRSLTDIFNIDDGPEDEDEVDEEKPESQTSFKAFRLLNALSDLMMIPFEMLADKSTRKEVCPTLSPPLIRMVLYSFVPDEFCPNPIPEAVLEALDSEDDFDVDNEESVTSFPCTANPTVYAPPSATSLIRIIGELGSQTLLRSGSVLRKSYTSDDELDELDSPITSIIKDNFQEKRNGDRQVIRYQLLRKVWKDSE